MLEQKKTRKKMKFIFGFGDFLCCTCTQIYDILLGVGYTRKINNDTMNCLGYEHTLL